MAPRKHLFDTTKYLRSLRARLLEDCDRHRIQLNRAWANDFPIEPGVYLFRYNERIIYVGESGNLRGRMKDMIDTRNHTLRRNIGNKLFSDVQGFEKATSKKKFLDTIEEMLNKYIQKNLTVCFMTVSLGRKELEEMIQEEFKPEYNQKSRRKAI